jgi:hypothetical protein
MPSWESKRPLFGVFALTDKGSCRQFQACACSVGEHDARIADELTPWGMGGFQVGLVNIVDRKIGVEDALKQASGIVVKGKVPEVSGVN